MLGGQVLVGSIMLAVTVAIQTLGIIGIIATLKSINWRPFKPGSYVRLTLVLVLIIFLVMLVHAAEIWSWALLYVWLEQFDSIERALYFSTVTFTTLGYGDITLDERWQLLSSFEAMTGIVMFGVSTAFVFAVMRKLFEVGSIVEIED